VKPVGHFWKRTLFHFYSEGAAILIHCLLTKMKQGHRAMHPQWGLPGCSTAPSQPPNQNFKKHRHFRHSDIKVCDLAFRWNQPLTTKLTLYTRSADCFSSRPSPYRAVNTFHLGYKTNQFMA
jgi:hypothetical protein